ncbi:hypothetical protein GO003_011995 [Methylicorpusculum oleiharenae]|nr:hypothetical protein [Methylicorpusculum oleiharenae]MCD2451115.1 hypothetical protein [Methylicorpusculum oleiharenae]
MNELIETPFDEIKKDFVGFWVHFNAPALKPMHCLFLQLRAMASICDA